MNIRKKDDHLHHRRPQRAGGSAFERKTKQATFLSSFSSERNCIASLIESGRGI